MASLSKGRDIHKRGFSLFSKGQRIPEQDCGVLNFPKKHRNYSKAEILTIISLENLRHHNCVLRLSGL